MIARTEGCLSCGYAAVIEQAWKTDKETLAERDATIERIESEARCLSDVATFQLDRAEKQAAAIDALRAALLQRCAGCKAGVRIVGHDWHPDERGALKVRCGLTKAERAALAAPGIDHTLRPKVVCLCGSTRFWEAFRDEGLRLTLEGVIVLSIGVAAPISMAYANPDTNEGREQKRQLDNLHKRKIDLADEILVLNVNGYIGDSTRSEIEYARKIGRPVRWLVAALDAEEGR